MAPADGALRDAAQEKCRATELPAEAQERPKQEQAIPLQSTTQSRSPHAAMEEPMVQQWIEA